MQNTTNELMQQLYARCNNAEDNRIFLENENKRLRAAVEILTKRLRELERREK